MRRYRRDHGIGGEYVTRLLEQAGQFRGFPDAVRTDQGPEFTSRAFMAWAHSRQVRHLLNDAGTPTQNAYIESFNGKFRDECLNEQWFETLAQARQEISRWRRDYNRTARSAASRPLSSPLRIASSLAMRSTNRRSSNLQTLDSATNLWHVYRGQVTRTCLTLFPVVDRLPRRADEEAALGRRQSEALPLGRHALGAETSARGNGVFVRCNRSRRRPSPTDATKLALELEHSALQGSDFGAVGCGGLLEGRGLASDLFARDTGDFLFQNRCDIRHDLRAG